MSKDEKTIKTNTTYQKEDFVKFANFAVKDNASYWIIKVCSVIIMICAIALLIFEKAIFEGIIYLLLGVFFMLYSFISKAYMLKDYEKEIGKTDKIEFAKESLKVTNINVDGTIHHSIEIPYNSLFRLVDNEGVSYIYMTRMNVLIIAKSNFEKEEDYNLVCENIKLAINEKNAKIVSNQQTSNNDVKDKSLAVEKTDEKTEEDKVNKSKETKTSSKKTDKDNKKSKN